MSVNNESIQGDLSVSRDIVTGRDLQVRGNTTLDHDLTVKGWINANNVNVSNKGVFTSLSELNEAYPSPKPGWLAIVGTSLPGDVYSVKNGTWTPTGGTSGGVSVNLNDYLQSQEITDITDIL